MSSSTIRDNFLRSSSMSFESSRTRTTLNEGRLVTSSRPLRSRIFPRGATTSRTRTRLVSARLLYSAPLWICRDQKRKRIRATKQNRIPETNSNRFFWESRASSSYSLTSSSSSRCFHSSMTNPHHRNRFPERLIRILDTKRRRDNTSKRLFKARKQGIEATSRIKVSLTTWAQFHSGRASG